MNEPIQLFPGGVVTREQQASVQSLQDEIDYAISSAKEIGVPQGFIVGLLHAIALRETQMMIDDA